MILTAAQLTSLAPIVLLALASIAVMLLTAFAGRRGAGAGTAALGLVVTLAAVPFAWDAAPQQVTPLLLVDRAALLYIALLAATTLGVAGLSAAYLDDRDERHGEHYILLLTAALGGTVLAASSHFATLFLGFELLSVSLFALLAYVRDARPGLEAGIKYLILSGVSSAFLLFGIALVYAELGTLEFAGVAEQLAQRGAIGAYLGAGLALLVGGVAFKLSLVPFHMWTPDVYQGAPAPVTAFLATVSKGAVFVVLLRYFLQSGAFEYAPVLWALSLLAGASMLLGNVLALLQQNVKRILAYSAISHLGYLLVAFIAGGAVAFESGSYYLAAYFASTLGAFGVVAVLSDRGGEPQRLADYRGLFWRRPWLAGVFSLMLLSLAGIPLTMGFVAKFYVVAASIEASLWVLLALVIAGSAIGLFYYLRVLVTLYLEPVPGSTGLLDARVPPAGRLVLAGAALAVIWLGVYPAPIVDLLRSTLP